ncbi:MAG: AraC family transcriptional regulator, partial [Proteobacteria bacterium]|nr:AraC family transcriptional regulator [Pseudomonadota bacterium]
YKIERILYNLLSNAIKFTPSGGAVIVGFEKEDDDLEISVKDTGVGILPEEQEMIFDRFRQADEGSKRQHGGTGIGLSLVEEFTKLHGGTVRVDSEPGKGSIFTVSLPYNSLKTAEKSDEHFDEKMAEFQHKSQVITPPALEQLTNTDNKIQSSQTEWQESGRQKILVIEDNSDMTV